VIERAREVMGRLEGEQEAGSRKQEAGGREQEAGGRGQEAGSREQEAGSREQEAGSREQDAKALREIGASYLAGEKQERLLVPADDEVVWAVLRELFGLDIANLTPVRALVALNEWQQRLRGENHG
jgi:hypothetical protein